MHAYLRMYSACTARWVLSSGIYGATIIRFHADHLGLKVRNIRGNISLPRSRSCESDPFPVLGYERKVFRLSVKNVFDSTCNLLFRVIAIAGYICYSMEKEEEFRLVS